MPQLLRACALGFAVLIAQIWHLVPAHAAAETHVPSAPVLPVGDDPIKLHADQLDSRIALAAAKRSAAEQPVVLQAAAPYRPVKPAPVHYSGTIQQIIQQAFSPLGQTAVNWALRVAMCESGDNPNALNPDGAAGLFQIMPGTWAGTPYASASEFDPVANAKAAAWIYARRGGSAWSCS